MRILLVSDTHGDPRGLAAVLSKLGRSVQMLVHLGDGASDVEAAASSGVPMPPWYAVRGNVDGDWSVPASRILWAYDRKILAVHGHTQLGGNSYRPLVQAAKHEGADACFFGHTHVPFWDLVSGVLLVNPGSLSRPRSRYGPSFAVVEAPPSSMGAYDVKMFELAGSLSRPRFLAIRP
ncbi:MAG: metallophosphoesterase [Spirochaetales bacterium]|nr:metallophosphoesterase [Spirochaetales bacterium]MBP7264800.1 metallophosphoesterase [Spirochaetia bacterium]